MRGRLTALSGALLLCWDAPTFRLLKLSVPVDCEQPVVTFVLATMVWRGVVLCLSSLVIVQLDQPGVSALWVGLRKLGWSCPVFAVVLAAPNLGFPFALSLTTAANTLVVLAAIPLCTALLSRLLGIRIPLHTWAACAIGLVSTSLVFAGASASSGGDTQIYGCIIALVRWRASSFLSR